MPYIIEDNIFIFNPTKKSIIFGILELRLIRTYFCLGSFLTQPYFFIYNTKRPSLEKYTLRKGLNQKRKIKKVKSYSKGNYSLNKNVNN